MKSKTFTLIGLALVALLATFTGGCTRIGPGHVGIKIGLAGSNRGVQPSDLTTGWVFYNPLGSQVVEYPTYVQNVVWTHDPNEGSPANEEITFTTKDAMVVSADVNLSYQLEQDKIPAFYTQFRSDDLTTFTDGYLHNVARDCFNETAGKYGVQDIMGDNAPFLGDARSCLQTRVNNIGVQVLTFGIIGAPRPPQTVINAINAKVQAQQIAIQKENEVAQAQADAQKAVAQAKGQADSQIAIATGEAESNRIRTASINPDIIRWREMDIQQQAISKWNGTMPDVSTQGATPGMLFNIPTSGK